MNDINEYRSRHLAFWNMEDTQRPLLGFTVGAGADSWSYWKYNKAAEKIFQNQNILPEYISPEDFVDDQVKYLEDSGKIEDDICRSAMPLASILWMEAILGCPVKSSGKHLAAEAIISDPGSFTSPPFDKKNPWIEKYLEFIDVYSQCIGTPHPIGQSILRGVSDLAAAILGVENSSMALLTDPESMKKLFEHITDWLEQFIKLQLESIPKFRDGYVIGQYEIWAPEPAIRIQEDFSVLYSHELFDEFLKPHDKKLASISGYTLIHLHSPSLKLIDNFLEINEIRAFQVTKDPGGIGIAEMLPSLIKIQEMGKPLIVKGIFTYEELQLMKNNLSVCGLCIQPVVQVAKDADSLLPKLRNWK
jgi:hypothetical protein